MSFPLNLEMNKSGFHTSNILVFFLFSWKILSNFIYENTYPYSPLGGDFNCENFKKVLDFIQPFFS